LATRFNDLGIVPTKSRHVHLPGERLGRIEAILYENSGNCFFKQRGYNWVFEEGIWSITACTVWKKFTSWADGLRATTLSLRTLAPNLLRYRQVQFLHNDQGAIGCLYVEVPDEIVLELDRLLSDAPEFAPTPRSDARRFM